MAILDTLLMNPSFQFALGMLANNQAPRLAGGRAAFGNALQGGLLSYHKARQQQLDEDQANQMSALRMQGLLGELSRDTRPAEVQSAAAMFPDLPLAEAMPRYFEARRSSEAARPVQVMTPQGPVWMAPGEAYGKPAASGQWGMSITGYDEQGRPLISLGEGGGAPLSKTTTSAVEKDILSLDDRLDQLYRVRDAFEPRFQVLGNKLGNKLSDWKSFLGAELDPQTRAELGAAQAHMAEVGQLFGTVVKEQAGTAMTPEEAKRVQAYLPNAGTGVFDGDSPAAFDAKMGSMIERVEWARMRKRYYLRHGIPHDFRRGETGPIGLESVPALVNQRGDAIEAEIRRSAPTATQEQIREQVRGRLKEEFGLQ